MKWLRWFKRSREEPRDTRIYTVQNKPPRPAPRPRTLRNVPEPDPIFGDTGNLAIRDETADDNNGNPYDTASWKLDPDKGLRRVDDDKTVTRDRGKKSSENNPYDTGSFRKGW